ncbi:MAG: FAD-dependent oxidoreductase [Clostridiales bacterium]|jgi:uncharacterized FAD-dependent dehydrogenase|nr:FAD-dependent oxidoreductase [Clostridiales bacterium]
MSRNFYKIKNANNPNMAQFTLPLGYTKEDLTYAITRVANGREYTIKRAIDARDKNHILFIFTLYFNDAATSADDFAHKLEEMRSAIDDKTKQQKVIIVGAGPAGLFCAYILSKMGVSPLVIEQGAKVEQRVEDIQTFFKQGKLNPLSNVQFGEGGAGTFSDGKLTTRVKSPFVNYCLKVLVENGAPDDILIESKPHIGTDLLRDVVKNIRHSIIGMGGKFLFNTKVDDFLFHNNKIVGVVAGVQQIVADKVVLAIGHSSRDTYLKLFNLGVNMQPKSFAVGVRIEHSAEFIGNALYGKNYTHPMLVSNCGYNLAAQVGTRGCFTFCTCPGGEVVSAASQIGHVVTNGMSNHARDNANTNTAILVSVTPADFADNTPLGGIKFQQHYEALAYKISAEAGLDYCPPACTLVELTSFINGVPPKTWGAFGDIKPSVQRGVVGANIADCLPNFVTETIVEGINKFDKKIKGYANPLSPIIAPEMRSSAPLRIMRDPKTLQSISHSGVYPIGEGSGYSGGIVSSAIDGVLCGLRICGGVNYLEY